MSPVTPPANSASEGNTNMPATPESGHTGSDNLTGDPDAMVDDALQKLQTGELPPMQAVLRIRDIADKYPGNVKANFTLGALSMQTGQFEKAVGRFKTVLEKQPDNIEALKYLAQAQMQLGDTASARETFNKALKVSGDDDKEKLKEELPELNNN